LDLDSTFASCRIEGIAGRGGMGIVYRATQMPLGRPVALKVVAPQRGADPVFHARFERETRVAASLDHPNVIPVYEAGELEDRLYLVMRWVQGGDLQQLLTKTGGIPPARAAEIVAQAGSALEAAHAAGLVHRDVKPANVLLSEPDGSGHVYLTDFGLTLETSVDARITTTGEWIGTVDFMAPEQFEDREVSPRTDVYALGCVLYATLTGRAPYSGRSVPETMLGHMHEPPPQPSEAPGVPAEFDEVVARALTKDPEDRYEDAAELVDAALAAAGLPPAARTAARRPSRALAAPDANGARTAVVPRTTTPLADRPATPSPAAAATARLSPPRRPHTARLIAAGAGVAAASVVGIAAATGALGGDDPAAPLDAGDVRDAAGAFATAYAHEDAGALRDTLTTDVARVTPADAQRGRAAVVREYRGQFDANETESYSLDDIEIRPGRLARATGRYEATRAGGEPFTGRIVLGVRRDDGDARIALIVVTPDS
jgi:serine/threonine-protein kinase